MGLRVVIEAPSKPHSPWSVVAYQGAKPLSGGNFAKREDMDRWIEAYYPGATREAAPPPRRRRRW